VLIVDDSITVRELLSMSFQKVGYRVEQARDGQDAWEKLRGGLRCDLVFCDIEMPRMDGLELLSRIRADSNLKHIPVAMLTSRGAERHRQTAPGAGGHCLLHQALPGGGAAQRCCPHAARGAVVEACPPFLKGRRQDRQRA
jgi:CheY-like chemotaxis protein